MSIVKWILVTIVACGTFMIAAIMVLLLADWAEMTPPFLPDPAVPMFALLVLGLPTALALWVVHSLAMRWRLRKWSARTSRGRKALWTLTAGYVITAILGVPAAQSQQTSWAVSEYKRLKASGSARVWEAHPRIRSYVAIPIAPCVIVSYHEYQLDGLYGFGGFELTLWYGLGVTSLGALPIWLS